MYMGAISLLTHLVDLGPPGVVVDDEGDGVGLTERVVVLKQQDKT
jgi:hypothetical protein